MKECNIQAKILKGLQDIPSLFVFKTITCNKRGIPDIICCYKGRFIAFEVKQSVKSKIPHLQFYQANKIIKCGGLVYVVTSLNEVLQILNKITSLEKDLK